MTQQKANINFSGAMSMIKKSKRPFAPIYELIVNALEAILQNPNRTEHPPEIVLQLKFAGLIEGVRPFECIDVIDNGVGFDDENFERFETLLDKSKGFNSRGCGRMQLLHRFGRVLVKSNFKRGDEFFTRSFECNPVRFVYNETCELTTDANVTGSSMTLLQPLMKKGERKLYDELSADGLKQDLRSYLALWFYLDGKSDAPLSPHIKIEIYENDKLSDTKVLTPDDVPAPVSEDIVRVHYVVPSKNASGAINWETLSDKVEEVHWAHFRLPEDEIDENAIWLCSKNVTVEQIEFRKIRKRQSYHGSRYLTVFYGDVLNDETNVSSEVDAFVFPSKKEIEKDVEENLFHEEGSDLIVKDEIEESIQRSLPDIYSDLVEAQKEVEKDVAAIAEAHGIPPEVADAIDAHVGDSEKRITEKLYRKQADQLADRNIEIKQIYEELVSLNPTDENYQEELLDRSSKLLSRIPQQNKEELSRYIIRREMVAKILKLILEQSLVYQTKDSTPGVRREKEGLIHDLIIRRKSDSTGELNDLWILNEEFVHFEGCSDVPIDQIKLHDGRRLLRDIPAEEAQRLKLSPDRRPDIFLFPEEGKCILVELKSPDTDLSDHLNQMTKYCNLIANYSAVHTNLFYCYLIGEKLSPIDLPALFEKTVNDDWVRPDEPIRSIHPEENREIIGHIHSEVILLSSIVARAQRRNRSFAERLGIRVN